MDNRLGDVLRRLDTLERILIYGNGKLTLLERVARLEEQERQDNEIINDFLAKASKVVALLNFLPNDPRGAISFLFGFSFLLGVLGGFLVKLGAEWTMFIR
jgi:hypothetical protein